MAFVLKESLWVLYRQWFVARQNLKLRSQLGDCKIHMRDDNGINYGSKNGDKEKIEDIS